MNPVYVVGVGMTRFGKFPELSLRDLAAGAVRDALQWADVSPDQVEAVYFGNAVAGTLTGQENIRGQVALRYTGLLGVPIVNVENACASSSTAFHLAWLAVASGLYDLVLAVGAEKLTHPDKRKTLTAFDSSVDVSELSDLTARLGITPEERGTRSIFMDLYAAGLADGIEADSLPMDRRYMALVSVKNHYHGARNPLAQYQKEVTVEEVLASRPVAGPLTLLMCAPTGDGAAAAVLASERWIRREGRRGVRIRASVLVSGRGDDRHKEPAIRRAAKKAYEQAGAGIHEMDLLEVHDATAPAELSIYEGLGLCDREEAGFLVEQRKTWLGGTLPVNPSGGLLARGHPIGATGLAQIAEVFWQLTDKAGSRQVEGARLALTQNAGGMVGTDAAAVAVHIFERAG